MPVARRHRGKAVLLLAVLAIAYMLMSSHPSGEVDEPAAALRRRADKGGDSNSSSESAGDSDAVKSFRAPEPQLIDNKSLGSPEPERLIFIGDIHGSVNEFNKLLETVNFKQGSDQIILVGDLVAKGPDSLGVVNKARSIGAWGTRGNHDDRVIRWRQFLDGPGKGLSEDEIQSLEDSGGLPYDDFKISKGHYDIAANMPTCDYMYLADFPAIITLPSPYDQWVVVHGGLDPSKAISQQSAEDVMTVRNIGPDGPTSETDVGDAWFDLWAEQIGPLGGLSASSLMEDMSSSTVISKVVSASSSEADGPEESGDPESSNRKRQVANSTSLDEKQFKKIIYGHDASRALQIHDITKGLDSRCVYGGQLTAFILPGEELVQVDCPNYDGDDVATSDNRRRRRDRMVLRAKELQARRRARRRSPPPRPVPKERLANARRRRVEI
ncbi:hypothetical protein H4S02_003832 [Coemansia sp. RSA 2611]|nr:hypothetical protein H4S01_003707 [Coemansia sp. RSA 2610]KAJ2386489.1 hypothetical protein H4S02_003832 [Coemansia sp. RSA 2611]